MPRLLLMLLLAACGCAPLPAQQDRALTRQFRAGTVEVFQVELTARSEVQGHRAEKIGARAYAAPLRTFSEEKITWRATRRILSVAADGSAEIEETLEQFSPLEEPPPSAQADEKEKADALLRRALLEWSGAGKLTLRYRESARGEIKGLAAESGPVFDDAPAVLTLWLRRALRPSAALRGTLGGAESRWSEPRSAALAPWIDARGAETGEWSPGPFPQLSIVRFDNLHIVQQITAAVPAMAGGSAEGQARFHAESISTVVGAGALLYGDSGSLVQATRSGAREISRTLEAVPGLPDRPRFRSLVSVDVRLTRSDFPPR